MLEMLVNYLIMNAGTSNEENNIKRQKLVLVKLFSNFWKLIVKHLNLLFPARL